MSGREGAAEARGRMGSLQALCRGLLAAWRSRDAGHESSWLWDGRRRVVGIAEASGGRALLFAELLAEGESYQLVRTAKEQLAGDVTMAEAAAMRAERDGWQALDFAICLSDEDSMLTRMRWLIAARARLLCCSPLLSISIWKASKQVLLHRASPCAAWLLLHLMMAAMRLCWQRTAWSSCRRSACSCRPSPLPLLRFRTSRF